MYIPKWGIALISLIFLAVLTWAGLMAAGKNPLPYPDTGSRIFTAASPESKQAIVDLLAQHGIEERFQVDSSGIRRSIMWDGTIINFSPPEVSRKLGNPSASIGLVSNDPVASANAAAAFLKSRGFSAEVVLDAEPALPIAFVVTDAMVGTVLNFRKHVTEMPKPD
jgi:hypothetical protein